MAGLPTRVVRVIKMVAVLLAALTVVWLVEDRAGLTGSGPGHAPSLTGGASLVAAGAGASQKSGGRAAAAAAPAAAAAAVATTVPTTHHEPLAGVPLSDDGLHIIFSTSCSKFQRWQAELLFYSHARVGQRGKITRLVSGCKDPKLAEGETTHKPDFFVDTGDKADTQEMLRSSNPKAMVYEPGTFNAAVSFKFANKPYSVRSWVENRMQPTDQVVAIFDPDQVLLRPLTVERPLPKNEMVVRKGDNKDVSFDGANIPRPGRPVAQRYPIGAAWGSDGHFNKKHRAKLDAKYGGKSFAEAVCGVGSPCTNYTDWEGQQVFSLGPPYILLNEDIKKLAPAWQDFTPPVVELTNRDLIADMWSYSMAAAHVHLPHTQIETYMVSNPYGQDEGFPFVMEALKREPKMSCHNPSSGLPHRGPTLLHFCQNLHVKDGRGRTWMYHKGHVPVHILECDQPLLKPPPDDFIATQKMDRDKRLAWNICQLYFHINEMAVAFKNKYCESGSFNTSKVVFLHQYSNNCWQKDPRKCYTFGTVEPERYDDLPKFKYDAP